MEDCRFSVSRRISARQTSGHLRFSMEMALQLQGDQHSSEAPCLIQTPEGLGFGPGPSWRWTRPSQIETDEGWAVTSTARL